MFWFITPKTKTKTLGLSNPTVCESYTNTCVHKTTGYKVDDIEIF